MVPLLNNIGTDAAALGVGLLERTKLIDGSRGL